MKLTHIPLMGKGILLSLMLALPVLQAGDAAKGAKDKKPAQHGFAKAAATYDQKAKQHANLASKATDQEAVAAHQALSKNFSQMADMKRDAMKAEQGGKSYNWDAYHKVKGDNGKQYQLLKSKRQEKRMMKKEAAGMNKKMDAKQMDSKKLEPKDQAFVKPMPEKKVDPKPAAVPSKKSHSTGSGFTVKTSLDD